MNIEIVYDDGTIQELRGDDVSVSDAIGAARGSLLDSRLETALSEEGELWLRVSCFDIGTTHDIDGYPVPAVALRAGFGHGLLTAEEMDSVISVRIAGGRTVFWRVDVKDKFVELMRTERFARRNGMFGFLDKTGALDLNPCSPEDVMDFFEAACRVSGVDIDENAPDSWPEHIADETGIPLSHYRRCFECLERGKSEEEDGGGFQDPEPVETAEAPQEETHFSPDVEGALIGESPEEDGAFEPEDEGQGRFE